MNLIPIALIIIGLGGLYVRPQSWPGKGEEYRMNRRWIISITLGLAIGLLGVSRSVGWKCARVLQARRHLCQAAPAHRPRPQPVQQLWLPRKRQPQYRPGHTGKSPAVFGTL